MDNCGAVALRERGLSLGDIARAGGVSRTAAGKWRDGTAVPGDRARDNLRREFGIAVEAWDSAPAVSAPAPTLGTTDTDVQPAESLEALLGGADAVRAAVRVHLGRIEQLRRDAIKRGSVEDAAAALELERRAIVEFGASIVEEGIVGSARWHEIRRAIVRAVSRYPDAARSIADELERIRA